MDLQKRACGYVRVSTDHQTELSPDAQIRLILEWCKNNGYYITKEDIYQDLGISGKYAEARPGFNQLIGTCKLPEHPYDCIVVWKFSRFARNQEESIVYKSLLRKQNVSVVSISEPIPEGLGGKLTEAILEIMDEYYSINLAQEVTRGMKEKALQGGYNSLPPYAYKYDKVSKMPYVIPEQAEVVRWIFNSYASDLALRAIATELNHRGIPTRTGKKWEIRTIKYLLQNPFYIGKVRWNYSTHRSKDRKYTHLNDSSEWIIADAKHEAIISNELFKMVNEKLDAIPQTHISTHGERKHWLSGMIRCATCGGPMNWHKEVPSKSTKAYFYCRNAMQGKCATRQQTIQDKMEQFFYEGMEYSISHKKYITNRLTPSVSEPPEISVLKKRLEEVGIKEKRIKTAYVEGIDSLEEYRLNKAGIETERKNITTKLEKALKSTNTPSDEEFEKTVADVLDVLKSENYSIIQKYEALTSIVSKIVYSKDNQTLTFTFV